MVGSRPLKRFDADELRDVVQLIVRLAITVGSLLF
jgi:hypothetical protein